MYLNLVQIAESFGVSETVIEDWIRTEGLPHVPERGRLFFDRSQVATWAAARGLAAQAGFLAPSDPALTSTPTLAGLLRRGGIWRNIAPAEVIPTLIQIVSKLPATSPSVRQLVAQKISAPDGVTIAPIGGGFALPHPSARIALGRDSGALALLLLRSPLPVAEPPADGVPLTRLFFFVASSPRAHLDLLGRLSRALSRGPLRQTVVHEASDAQMYEALGASDAAPVEARREGTR